MRHPVNELMFPERESVVAEPTFVRFEAQYPEDPRDLPDVHANHVALSASEEEVYLDFCTIQPQARVDAEGSSVLPALVRSRVIMTRGHALQLAASLSDVLRTAGASNAPGRIQ